MPHKTPSHLDRQQDYFEGKPSILERLIKNPGFPRTMRKKIQFVGQALAGCERILEVGTGHGLELDLLLSTTGPGIQYVGIDLATAPLRDALPRIPAERRRSTALLASLVEHLPFHDRAFDGVFCVDVLHHAQSQEKMLTELRRVLRPGGKLLCVEPNRVFPVNVIYLRNPVENGLFKFTRSAARRWAAAAGLSDLEIVSLPVFFPSFPPAFSGTYAALERLLGGIPGIRDVSTTRVLIARRPADTTGAP
jgi:SAM-dependent methyltransferase